MPLPPARPRGTWRIGSKGLASLSSRATTTCCGSATTRPCAGRSRPSLRAFRLPPLMVLEAGRFREDGPHRVRPDGFPSGIRREEPTMRFPAFVIASIAIVLVALAAPSGSAVAAETPPFNLEAILRDFAGGD